MAKTLAALKEEQHDIVAKARTIQDTAKAQGRATEADWTQVEADEIAALTKSATDISNEYAALEKRLTTSSQLDRLSQNDKEKKKGDKPDFDRSSRMERKQDRRGASIIWRNMYGKDREARMTDLRQSTDDYDENIRVYMTEGPTGYAQYQQARMAAGDAITSEIEERAGYFLTSEAMTNEIIKEVDDATPTQGLATVMVLPSNAASIASKVRKSRANSFAWEGENTTNDNFDTSLKYGKRGLTPHYIRGAIDISRDIIRKAPSALAEFMQEMILDFSFKLEQAFLYGDGNQKPLGLMTASPNGLDTDRDIAGRFATKLDFDDFVKAKFNLKFNYHSRAKWMLHRLILMQVALLKDGNGQYLWSPSRVVGEPEAILGIPVVPTEWMPYTLASNLYVGIFGDFSWYRIVYDLAMEIQRLYEVKAQENIDRFLFQAKLDAQPMLSEAFIRMKTAT